MKKIDTTKKGFTLVEIMVSVTIFSFVMLMVASMLLAIIQANTKAQTLKTTLDNLNVALDEMSRTIRTGTDYSVPSTCVSGTTNCFSFKNQQGQQEQFGFSQESDICNQISAGSGCITRTMTTSDGPQGPLALTGTDVNIGEISFIFPQSHQYLGGGVSEPYAQPYVTILVHGSAGSGAASSTFDIETTISEREFGKGI